MCTACTPGVRTQGSPDFNRISAKVPFYSQEATAMLPRGKVQKAHFNYFCDLMAQIEWDLHEHLLESGRVPRGWHQIARARGAREKLRLTIRVEEDVVKFFRSFGKGYQQRMNDVLAAWMHGRLAAVIDGPDAADIGQEVRRYNGRRRIGDMELIDHGLYRTDDGRLINMKTKEVLVDGEDVETRKNQHNQGR
jgi:hypothetical protein